MREIKFRVWDNGLMKKFVRIPFYLNCEGYVYKDNDPHGVDMSGKRSVSPMQNVIAMQYTGLKDKNGIECYEGDKIKNQLTIHRGVVVYSDEFATFCVIDENGKWVCSMGAMGGDGFEILGNIYEKP